jgi:hypothetical protein
LYLDNYQPRTLEVEWQAASSPGANDGRLAYSPETQEEQSPAEAFSQNSLTLSAVTQAVSIT